MVKLMRAFLSLFLLCSACMIAGSAVDDHVVQKEKEKFSHEMRDFLSKVSAFMCQGIEVEIIPGEQGTHWTVRPVGLSREKKNTRTQLINNISDTVGCVAALGFILSFMERPTGAWDLCKKSLYALLTTWCAGGIISWICRPVAALLVNLFYSDDQGVVCNNKLIEQWLNDFLKQWPQNKAKVLPASQEFFDAWYELYQKNGNEIVLSDYEAQAFIVQLLSSLLRDQKIVVLDASVPV